MSLEVQISWQAQRFVNLTVQMSWQVQRFVTLKVQISWQAWGKKVPFQSMPFVSHAGG